MNAQDYYQLYRKKTTEAGFVPIGRQRFAGIIKTISLIPETVEHINEKQANGAESKDGKSPITHVINTVCDNCTGDFFVTTINGGKKCDKCGKPLKQTGL